MKFSVIASGSKGNLTYIEFNNRSIIIDAGISLPNAKSRIENIDFSKVTEIFITHEHTDHVKFLATFAKKIDATIYISKKTLYALPQALLESVKDLKIVFIEANSKYLLTDNIEFYTLELSHDAVYPLGYIFKSENKAIAYVTDTGFFPVKYIKAISSVDAIIIEANHNVEMLMNSDREAFLKERILSPIGHMSNYICLEVLKKIITGNIKKIVLAHISKDCNSLECIEEEILIPLKEIYKGDIYIASQDEALEIIEI